MKSGRPINLFAVCALFGLGSCVTGLSADWESILRADMRSSGGTGQKTTTPSPVSKSDKSPNAPKGPSRALPQAGQALTEIRNYRPSVEGLGKTPEGPRAEFLSRSETSGVQVKEALLIANGNYLHFGKLSSPTDDAHLLVDSLRSLGFSVTLVENASREGMLDALQSFQDRLKGSGGIALFHYGGHGVQVDGKNYLIPVDANIPDERKVTTRAVDVEEVMSTLDASGASADIVVLDACRDNPLPSSITRSATRGLSVVQRKPKNSLIVYSAEPGSKALDGLFTPTLANALLQKGKSVSQIMKEVRRTVFQKSDGTQTPGEYDQLFEDLYLYPEKELVREPK